MPDPHSNTEQDIRVPTAPTAPCATEAFAALDTLLAPLPVIVWEMDWTSPGRTPRLTYVSDGAERILGYPARFWLEDPSFVVSIIHPEDRGWVAAMVMDGARGENESEIRFRCLASDGRVVWLEGRRTPILDAEGNLIGWRGVTIDVTDRVHAQEALRASEARYHRITDTSTEGIWAIDEHGATTYINHRVTELLGYTLEDLRGTCVFTLVESPSDHLRALVEQHTAWDPRKMHEIRLRARNGALVWVSVAVSPVYGDDGGFRGALCLLNDITEQKRTEEALRRSERQYRQLTENATDVVARFDRDLRCLHINRAVKSVTGMSPEQIIGKRMDALGVLPERVAYWAEHISAVLDSGRQRTVDGEYDTPDGRRYFQVTLSPEYEDDGKVSTCLFIAHDVTDRRRMEERQRLLADAGVLLSASLDHEITIESMTRLIVPRLADCCLVDLLDDNGSLRRAAVVHVDPAKEAILHELRRRHPFRPSDPYGIPLAIQSSQPEMADQIEDEWLVAVAEDDEQLRLLRSIGMVSSMIVPLTARGRSIGAMTLITAESGRRYTQDDLALAEDLARRCALAMDNARLYQEVQQMNRAKDDFLAVLSHELRNPLAAIQNALHATFADHAPDSPFQEVRSGLEHEVRSMARLVEDLLDVARITRGQIRLRPEAVDMASVVESAAERVRPLLMERRHHLEIAPGPRRLMVHADPVRLEQVFCNLLNNAAKYTPPGGHIRVSLEQDAGLAVVCCEDNGIGIGRDALPMLFRPFYQVDPGRSVAEDGLGLGLSLVRSLVEMHGGRVEARSEGPGRGSAFLVRWPLAEAFDLPAEEPAGSGAAAPETTGPVTRKILLVEDNAFSARMLARILADAGHTVRTATDGQLALTAAHNDPPDIVLLDIGLPEMDGYEVARRMSAMPELGHTLLIALTGYGREEDRERAFAAGFHHHLVKPVDFDALLALLANSHPSGRAANTEHADMDRAGGR